MESAYVPDRDEAQRFTDTVSANEHVTAILAAVSPKPVNLLINSPFLTVAEAAALGVRRISVGGTLARTAWGAFLDAAHEIAEQGSFTRFEQLPNVDALFQACANFETQARDATILLLGDTMTRPAALAETDKRQADFRKAMRAALLTRLAQPELEGW